MWNSLYAVVEFMVTTFEAQINFGANLFPSKAAKAVYGAGACTVNGTPEVGVAPDNADEILAAIPAQTATNLEGATPATAGVEAAVAHLDAALALPPDLDRAPQASLAGALRHAHGDVEPAGGEGA